MFCWNIDQAITLKVNSDRDHKPLGGSSYEPILGYRLLVPIRTPKRLSGYQVWTHSPVTVYRAR